MKVDHVKIDMLSTITRIGAALHTSKDLHHVLDIITDAAISTLKVTACTVKVLNERHNKLEIYSTKGLSDNFITNVGAYGMFRSPLNQKAIQGETVIIEDTSKPEEYALPTELLDEGIKSIVCVPLKIERQVQGVLSIYHTEPLKFGKRETALIKFLAEQGASVIESFRRFKRNETLMQIAKTMNSSLDLDFILKEIVIQAARTMKVRAASLRLLDEANNKLIFKTSFGLSKKYMEKISAMDIEKSPIDTRVLNTKQVVDVFDMTIDERVLIPDEAQDEGLASMLCVPLMIQDKPLGILKIYTTSPTIFTDEEKNFLMAMGELSAIAIRNASLYEKLHSMYLITSSLSATIELDKVMELMTIHAADYLNSMGAQIILWDRERERFAARSIYKLSEEFVDSVDMNRAWSAVETMKGNTIIVSDMENDDRMQFRDVALQEGILSMISVPLKSMDRLLGILQVYCKQKRNFTADEIEFITALANHGAISIENAKLHEHFRSKYEELVDDIYIWHDWTSYVIRS